MLIFIIIIFIFLLIFLVPIPLKFTAHYSKDRYYLKLYNIVIFSNTGGVLNKFLDKDEKIEPKKRNKKRKTKIKPNAKKQININSKSKKGRINYLALIKNIYFALSRNKFKPSIKFSNDTLYSLGDASRTAIFVGVFYNINPILLYIFSILFKVKLLNSNFKPIFKDKILFEITINSIITFNLAQIINIGIIILKSIFDDSIIKK